MTTASKYSFAKQAESNIQLHMYPHSQQYPLLCAILDNIQDTYWPKNNNRVDSCEHIFVSRAFKFYFDNLSLLTDDPLGA